MVYRNAKTIKQNLFDSLAHMIFTSRDWFQHYLSLFTAKEKLEHAKTLTLTAPATCN